MTEPGTVYCPFYEVTVKMSSEALNRLGAFPVFLLESVEKGVAPAVTASATMLNDSTVQETLFELLEYGLLEKTDGRLVLSELGGTYLRLRRMLAAFDEQNETRFAVNTFTGQLEDVSDPEWFSNTERPADAPVLRQNVSKLIVSGGDLPNTADYLFAHIDTARFGITEEDRKYVSFRLSPKEPLFYVPYNVRGDALLIETEPVRGIPVRVPAAKLSYTITHRDVEGLSDRERIALKTLGMRTGLLSDDGQYLLALLKKLDELNAQPNEAFFELWNTQKLEPLPEHGRALPPRSDMEIPLPERAVFREKTAAKDGTIRLYRMERFFLRRYITFDALIQTQMKEVQLADG